MKGFISSRMGSTHIREGYFTRFDQPNPFSTNSALNHHVPSFSFLPLPLVSLQSPLYLSIFSTLLPLNRLLSPVVWTLVDAVSAYALVDTWRARSSAGKGRGDALLAALYVDDLEPTLYEHQGIDDIASYQLLVQPVSVSPFTGVLYIIDIEHVAFVEHHVRCARSVNIQPDANLLVAHTTYQLGKTSPALFCLAALVHVSLSSILLVFPVMMLLLGRPKSSLANPMPISINFGKGRITSLEFLAHFVALSLTSTLISGGFQWMWQTWFVECVFSTPLMRASVNSG